MKREATCFECDEVMEETGRNTLYCPSCDVCFECGCPNADGFQHYAGCAEIEEEDSEEVESESVPDDFPVKVLGPDDGAEDRATCGSCRRSWDDAVSTSWTPAPAGRCPFEYYH